MNVFFYVFISWWKFLFLNPVNIVGILHGIFVGIMLSRVRTTFKLLVIIGPATAIVIAIAIIYRRNNSQIESKWKTYGFHAFLYANFVDGIVTKNEGNLIFACIFLGLIYLIIPLGYSFFLKRQILYVPNRNLDVSADYTSLDLELQQENCTICLEQLESDVVKLTNCSHTFHVGCITEWLVRKRECPVCRQDSETSIADIR